MHLNLLIYFQTTNNSEYELQITTIPNKQYKKYIYKRQQTNTNAIKCVTTN